MPRRTEVVVVTAEGRDKGKVYHLTEMPAMQAESWAQRALLALVRSGGAQIPDDVAGMGLLGIATLGVQALGGIQYAELKPLMDEMMQCITYQPDPDRPEIRRPLNGQDDIEEVATILMLRERLIDLHLGFSARSLLSSLQDRAPNRITADTPAMPTSPTP